MDNNSIKPDIIKLWCDEYYSDITFRLAGFLVARFFYPGGLYFKRKQ